jgi:hypothetical protein
MGKPKVQVGQEAVQSREKGSSRQKAHHGGDPRVHALGLGHLHAGDEEGEDAGRQHHPGGEAQHPVQELAAGLPGQEDAGRSQGGEAPGEEPAQKGVEEGCFHAPDFRLA